MSCISHTIIERKNRLPVDLPSIVQFTLGPGEATDIDSILADGWSVYGVDIDRDHALFVWCQGGIDPKDAPFLYADQFEKAERVAVVPLADFVRVGEALPLPDRLGMLYSTGRSGSTLASRIFAELPGVISLSEPDVIIGPVYHRFHRRENELIPIYRAGLGFLSAAFGSHDDVFVLKPRSEAIFGINALSKAAPRAHAAFLYRDVLGYVASIHRFVQRVGLDPTDTVTSPELDRVWHQVTGATPLDVVAGRYGLTGDVYFEELSSIFWLLRIEEFQAARRSGHRIEPVHYDDLNADRLAQTARLLEACGIDPARAPQAMAAFERDAHRGGFGANAKKAVDMDEASTARTEAVISRLGIPDLKSDRL
jgi:hypothetical protein